MAIQKILNCLGDIKQDIWYNQYSIEEYEQESKENKPSDFYSQRKNIQENNSNNLNESIQLKEPTVLFNEQTKNGSMIVERRRVKSQFWQVYK